MKISAPPLPWAEAQIAFRAQYLEALLVHTGGNVLKAAKLAGVARPNFYQMLDLTGRRAEILSKSRAARVG